MDVRQECFVDADSVNVEEASKDDLAATVLRDPAAENLLVPFLCYKGFHASAIPQGCTPSLELGENHASAPAAELGFRALWYRYPSHCCGRPACLHRPWHGDSHRRRCVYSSEGHLGRNRQGTRGPASEDTGSRVHCGWCNDSGQHRNWMGRDRRCRKCLARIGPAICDSCRHSCSRSGPEPHGIVVR